LKERIVIPANAGITATYKAISIAGDSVIKKNCPANRKANVAKSQIKNPTPSTGIINDFLSVSIFKNFSKGNMILKDC